MKTLKKKVDFFSFDLLFFITFSCICFFSPRSWLQVYLIITNKHFGNKKISKNHHWCETKTITANLLKYIHAVQNNKDRRHLLSLWCSCRLRAHSSSSSHSTSMAGPLHRNIQTPTGRVLRLPRATERPRLSEWSIVLKHEISLSHSVHCHLLSPAPSLYEYTGTFSQAESQLRWGQNKPRGLRGNTARKTCRNNDGLYINQFLKRHAKTVSTLLSETIHRLTSVSRLISSFMSVSHI